MSDLNIAKAMLATDETEREKYLYREVIKSAVMTQMFCPGPGCGRILDMRKAVLLENEEQKASAVLCLDCSIKISNKIPAHVKITYAQDLYRKAKKVRS